jgi:energy-coupling factor transporter ATP-binding protein EcfA2
MPIDPASALLLFALFKASEKAIGYAGGKIADAMTEPIWDSVKKFGKSLAGKDETALRWKAFTTAFDESREQLLQKPRNPKTAQQLAEILGEYDTNRPYDPDWLNDISVELERASLLTEQPDVNLITELCAVSLEKQGKSVDRAEVADEVIDFVQFFQDSLFNQEVYQDLMLKRAWWDKLKKPRYDSRDRYINQVIKHYQDLDFVGIPELKDRQALRIEDVFISLQSEVETTELTQSNLLVQNDRIFVLDIDGEEIPEIDLTKPKQKIKRKLSTNQALHESNKLVVLGDPGSGKTTLLKYITLAFAENRAERLGLQEKRLPIFIRLYDYVAHRKEIGKDGFSFTDYLNKFSCDHFQLLLAPDFFQIALENGDCCVCLDGLDELGGAGARREVTAAVAALVNRYPRNRFIVTSRIVGYDEAPLNRREFPHHTIQPLSDEDIKAFVEKWYTAREKDPVVRAERITHLTKTIMDEPRIKSLATNPLMLTIIALVHRIEAELPHERVKLYDKCVTTLVETRDKVRGLKYDLRRRLLEQLAYWMHSRPSDPNQPDGRTRDVREGDLEIQLVRFLLENPRLALDEEQALKEAREFISLAKTRSGLLVERGEGLYSFAHLTFQEYLVACDIEHSQIIKGVDGLWDEIEPKLHNSHCPL